MIRRNRRRYGGYIVHAGVAVALIGVAASTSFQHSRDGDDRAGPERDASTATAFRYVRPTAIATAQKISFGAVLAVTSGGQRVDHAAHRATGCIPSQDPTLGPIGRFFDGSNESRVGLRRRSDPGHLDVVIQPNIDAAATA